jgi:hypothetical protein
MPLCSTCASADIQVLESETDTIYLQSYGDMHLSSEDCELCALVLDVLRPISSSQQAVNRTDFMELTPPFHAPEYQGRKNERILLRRAESKSCDCLGLGLDKLTVEGPKTLGFLSIVAEEGLPSLF